MKHQRLALCTFVVLALLATACGSNDTSSEPTDVEPTVTSQEEPVNTDDGEATPTEAPEPTATEVPEPDEQPVDSEAEVIFATFVGGGFTVVDVALSEFPQLVVMSDGTTYQAQGDVGAFPTPLTPAIERRHLDADAIAAIGAAVDGSEVLVSGANLDLTSIADAPSTTVWALADGELVSVNAVALGFDDGSTEAPDLQARTELRSLIEEVGGIVSAAGGGELTEPPFLGVLAFPGLGFEENATALTWPVSAVPVPVGGGTDCVVIEGEDLTAVWTVAQGATTQTPWTIDGESKALAFRPVFAHEDFC